MLITLHINYITLHVNIHAFPISVLYIITYGLTIQPLSSASIHGVFTLSMQACTCVK